MAKPREILGVTHFSRRSQWIGNEQRKCILRNNKLWNKLWRKQDVIVSHFNNLTASSRNKTRRSLSRAVIATNTAHIYRNRVFEIRRECGIKVTGQRHTVEVQKLMDPSHRACRREAIRAKVQAIDPPPPVDLPSIFAPSLYLPTFIPSRYLLLFLSHWLYLVDPNVSSRRHVGRFPHR